MRAQIFKITSILLLAAFLLPATVLAKSLSDEMFISREKAWTMISESMGKTEKPPADFKNRTRKINLVEALRMLFHLSNTDTNSVELKSPKGISSNAWYAKDIAYAMEHFILTQQIDGRIFPPDRKLKRGELKTLIYRFLENKNDGAQFGYASWYGDGLAKTKLKTGIEFADRFLTAAHKTIPIGTILRVTNMANEKHVDVVVNDRGPYVTGRIIDLSKTAFSALENPSAGIIYVQIETLIY